MNIQFFLRMQEYLEDNQSVRLAILGVSTVMQSDGSHRTVYLVDGILSLALPSRFSKEFSTGFVFASSEMDHKLSIGVIDSEGEVKNIYYNMENVVVNL